MSIVSSPYTGFPDWQREALDGPALVNDSAYPVYGGYQVVGLYYVGQWQSIRINAGFGGGGYPEIAFFTWYTDEAMDTLVGEVDLYFGWTYETPYQNITIPNQGPWLQIAVQGPTD